MRRGLGSPLSEEVTTGAGSTVSVYPNVMNNVLGTKFKLVLGYPGSREISLAIDKGEVTDKGSINQRAVLKHRDSLVQALHDGSAPNGLQPQ